MHAIATSLMGYMYPTIVHAWLKYFCPSLKVQVSRLKPKFFFYVSFPDKIGKTNKLSFTRLIKNMYPMMDTALVQNEGHRSKVKVTSSYHVKIGEAPYVAFYAVFAWSSTHCHTRRLPSQYV